MKSLISKNAKETQQIAQELARDLISPTLITLTGNLGTGKTTFVQGLAKGLGINETINSPTFLILKRYTIADRNPKIANNNLYHVDLYRLTREEDIKNVGLLDILKENDSIVVIEWSEKMGRFLPKERIDINFKYISENERKIIIKDFISNDIE